LGRASSTSPSQDSSGDSSASCSPRSPAARAIAIGIGLGFLLVAEGLISIVAPDASTYLPGGTLDTLASGGNDQLAWGAALGLVVLYGVVAATVSLAVFRTRDIVS